MPPQPIVPPQLTVPPPQQLLGLAELSTQQQLSPLQLQPIAVPLQLPCPLLLDLLPLGLHERPLQHQRPLGQSCIHKFKDVYKEHRGENISVG